MEGRAAYFRRWLARCGPVSVAAFMAEALGHPRYGYYQSGAPFGAAGDFITAPEISQMFGELIGLWLAQCWRDRGAPGRFILLEAGPGRGVLMADILRATRAVPGFHRAVRVHLLETSAPLRALQRRQLADAGVPLRWHDRLATVPGGLPLYLVANEFFDALPVRQFVRQAGSWRERLVTLDAHGDPVFTLSRHAVAAARLPLDPARPARPGDIVETRPAAVRLAAFLGRRIARHDGAGLVLDYGHDGAGSGDSLQAVRDHAAAPVLARPGEADLTAHVDFAALAAAFGRGGATAAPLRGQGAFLDALGIRVRAAALLRSAGPDQARQIRTALHRLTAPGEMGVLFKALGLRAPGSPELPGLPSVPACRPPAAPPAPDLPAGSG